MGRHTEQMHMKDMEWPGDCAKLRQGGALQSYIREYWPSMYADKEACLSQE